MGDRTTAGGAAQGSGPRVMRHAALPDCRVKGLHYCYSRLKAPVVSGDQVVAADLGPETPGYIGVDQFGHPLVEVPVDAEPPVEELDDPAGRLGYDSMAALANAHLLNVCPGVITSIRTIKGEIVVTSSLRSPFPEKTPSQWETRFDRRDGSTISQVVTQMSVAR